MEFIDEDQYSRNKEDGFFLILYLAIFGIFALSRICQSKILFSDRLQLIFITFYSLLGFSGIYLEAMAGVDPSEEDGTLFDIHEFPHNYNPEEVRTHMLGIGHLFVRVPILSIFSLTMTLLNAFFISLLNFLSYILIFHSMYYIIYSLYHQNKKK